MNDVELYFFGNETLGVARHAHQCTVCQSMAFVFINRFGDTTCVGCADQLTRYERALAEMMEPR